jgi:hypothetical protein
LGPRAGLDAVVKRKIPAPAENRTPTIHPVVLVTILPNLKTVRKTTKISITTSGVRLKIDVRWGVMTILVFFFFFFFFFFQTGVRQDCLFRLHFMKFMSNNNSSAQSTGLAE